MEHPLFIPSEANNIVDKLLDLRNQFAYDIAAPYCNGKIVLELGCNTGYGTFRLAEEARHVYGVDSSLKAIETAKELHSAPNITFIHENIERLEKTPMSPDVIVMFQIIEHLENPLTTLDYIRELISHDALFLVSTPNALLRLMPGQKPWNPFHVKEYAPADLKKLLEAVS